MRYFLLYKLLLRPFMQSYRTALHVKVFFRDKCMQHMLVHTKRHTPTSTCNCCIMDFHLRSSCCHL